MQIFIGTKSKFFRNEYWGYLSEAEKLFANFDKLRIIEYLTLFGESNVSDIIKGIGSTQLKVSQYLKRLRDDGFVTARRNGRFIYYTITQGVHKTTIQWIHKRYDSLENKTDF